MKGEGYAAIVAVLQAVRDSEGQLEAIRQLINEQLEFSIEKSYATILDSHQDYCGSAIDVFNLRSFMNELGQGLDDGIMERVIKFYGGKLQIGRNQWKSIVVTREDRLLAKLAQERKQIVQEQPLYLSNYVRKLWIKQYRLHQIIRQAGTSNALVKDWVCSMQNGETLDESRFKQFCMKFLGSSRDECPLMSYGLIRRYIKRGLGQQHPLTIQDLQSLLLFKNNAVIEHYLQTKQEQLLLAVHKHKANSNPFLHKEFSRLIKKETSRNPFSFRQIRSIDQHIGRNKTLPTSQDIRHKIVAYTSELQRSLHRTFICLKQIANLTRKMDKDKVQLLSNYQCSFKRLYKQISANSTIVPSELQHYLQTLQIAVSLPQVFLLFKRYADPITGRMSASQFCAIFKSQRETVKTNNKEITTQFRKACISCLLREMPYESKVEQIKRKLIGEVDLRQIFHALDQDSDGSISGTDLEVLYLKVRQQALGKEELGYIWGRMGSKSPAELITYEQFMYEMIPKTKEYPHYPNR